MSAVPPPPPPAEPGPDARAVLHAAEQVTTQIRRIADALTQPAPVIRHSLFSRGDVPTEHCAHRGPHPGFTCAEVDASQPYFRVRWDQEQQAPDADDEQAQRWSRREPLLVLLTRLQRGLTFTPAEANTLRHLVETEMGEADSARTRAEQAEDLLRVAHETSNRSEAERAAAVQRADTADRVRAEVQRDRDQHAAVLAEVLAAFVHEVPGYRTPRRSAEVDVVTLDKWRSVVASTSERPWWQQVAEAREETALDLGRDLLRDGLDAFLLRLVGADNAARLLGELHGRAAELQQAQAAIERVRAVLAGRWGKVDPDLVRAALDGTDSRATDAPICEAYQPPTNPDDSGYCARCGMRDVKHTAPRGGAEQSTTEA